MTIGIEDLTDIEEKIDIKDLEVGKIYKKELIIDRTEGLMANMVTLRRVNKEEIHKNNYLVKISNSIDTSISFNGYQEYFPGDDGYTRLNKKLLKAGL